LTISILLIIELYLEVEGEEEPYIKEIVGIQKVAV